MEGNMSILTEKVKKTSVIDIDSTELSSNELAQRVAILKRFKILLTQQRDRFSSYLDLLDKQQGVIESGSAEDLLSYVEIEEKIVADIFSIQKVIDPLEEMYNSITIRSINITETDQNEVPTIKASLENLKKEAVIRSTKNKEMLSKRMMELRSEITALRNNPYVVSNKRSSFGSLNTSSLVDLQG
jgi:hypothetical protein